MENIENRIIKYVFLISILLFVILFVAFALIYFGSIFKTDSTFFSNEVLLGLLQVVLAFAGLISYLTYKVILNKIEKSAGRMLEEERNLSKAELLKCTAYFHFRTYEKNMDEIVRSLGKNKNKIKENRKNLLNKSVRELTSVMWMIEDAIKFLTHEKDKEGSRKELQREKDCIMCKCVNNYAYYLTKKWEFRINYTMNEDGILIKRDYNAFKTYLSKNKEESREFEGEKQDVIDSINYLIENKCSTNFKFLRDNIADTINCAETNFLIKFNKISS